ncbi:MAG: Crp/Fnr family transcriptional regulator [Bacteroidetes bacterium]|nr:Crp/Fnr family transcriptional regulator [Bacteroidota bacterium]MBL0140281.1 Crp/Fnr family transcriptional regulator [Bacteroidota bacterium]
MRQMIECSNCTSSNCFLKKFCKGENLSIISALKNQNIYKKGDAIFREGNTMQGIHFIMRGGIKVVTTNINGREQVVRLASDGDILGHRVLGNDKYYFNAIAMMETIVCFIETNVFREACMNNPEFAYNLILFYALELRRTELRVKYHAQMNIREKVAEAFDYLNEIFGIDPKSKTLNIELSRREIADIAGTTPEQVTRQLSDFESEKLIYRTKRDIQILNKKGIENIVRDYKIE